jgi:hypothetical protein
VGTWGSTDEIADLWSPARVVEPVSKPDRDRWQMAVDRAKQTVPELSSLDF